MILVVSGERAVPRKHISRAVKSSLSISWRRSTACNFRSQSQKRTEEVLSRNLREKSIGCGGGEDNILEVLYIYSIIHIKYIFLYHTHKLNRELDLYIDFKYLSKTAA